MVDRCADLGLVCEQVGGRDAIVVRSARPASEFDAQRQRAMRDLLTPVLDVRPYRKFYMGPPLRVLKDPGTAFKYVPAEIDVPWFEDWPMPADRGKRTYVPDNVPDPRQS